MDFASWFIFHKRNSHQNAVFKQNFDLVSPLTPTYVQYIWQEVSWLRGAAPHMCQFESVRVCGVKCNLWKAFAFQQKSKHFQILCLFPHRPQNLNIQCSLTFRKWYIPSLAHNWRISTKSRWTFLGGVGGIYREIYNLSVSPNTHTLRVVHGRQSEFPNAVHGLGFICFVKQIYRWKKNISWLIQLRRKKK